MGAIAGMAGVGGGASGSGFGGPTSANITPGTDPAQLAQSYKDAQNGIAQNQSFVNALQGQNGIGNQSSVFQQQQGLANQLQGVANGTGPNPALAQLNQTTGANIAAQNAMMAGQRGTGANAGLLARQAAMQGGNLQQQAVGQGATMQANQQLNAMNSLQNQQANMANLSGQQVGQQAGALNSLNSNTQGEQNILQNANSAANTANVAMQSNVNNNNAALAQAQMKNQGDMLGGALGGLGSAASGLLGAAAPLAAGVATGGASSLVMPALGASAGFAQGGQVGGPQSGLGQFLKNGPMRMAEGGQVPAMVSPGEVYLNPTQVEKVASGKADPIKAGEKIPGKAAVKGNSYENDTVPKTLQTGGIVLPKSVMESKNPHWAAHKFVSDIMAKNSLKRPK